MTVHLHPPLAWIRDGLHPAHGATPGEPAAAPPADEFEAGTPPDMPPYLKDLIERKTAAAAAHPGIPPAVGQIRHLPAVRRADGSSVRALARDCGVLLYAHLGDRCWKGWLVAPETDYATERDLVLEADDGALDPAAGMVLTWAPVNACIDADARILGSLPPARIAAVMALAESPPDTSLRPRPGHVFARDLDPTFTITSGTPLGGTDDPRRDYQALYGQLAEELTTAAGTVAAKAGPRPGSLRWLVHALVRPSVTFGALGAAVALAVYAYLLAPSLQPPAGNDIHRSALQPPAPGDCDGRGQLRVVFRTDTPHGDIVQLLRNAGASIADGPSASGEVLVALGAGKTAKEVAATLRASPAVASVATATVRPDCANR